MIRLALFIWVILFFSSGCNVKEHEKKLQQKEAELNEKEQELFRKEQALQAREDALAERENILDSSTGKLLGDSPVLLHPQLPGVWNATMNCTETTCPGSAVGDTKTEQWQIDYQNNNVIVRAISGNNQIRVYSGNYSGNTLELTSQPNDSIPSTTKMIVRLQETKENEMEGQREIIRGEECRVVYALQLKKQ
jgi:hypothetical protein